MFVSTFNCDRNHFIKTVGMCSGVYKLKQCVCLSRHSLSVCHVRALWSHGRRYQHDFFAYHSPCIIAPSMVTRLSVRHDPVSCQNGSTIIQMLLLHLPPTSVFCGNNQWYKTTTQSPPIGGLKRILILGSTDMHAISNATMFRRSRVAVTCDQQRQLRWTSDTHCHAVI